MLKARTLAYDGRGNAVVKSAAEVEDAFAQLSQDGNVQLYVERWRPDRAQTLKIALDVARGMDHLHTVRCPGPQSGPLAP